MVDNQVKGQAFPAGSLDAVLPSMLAGATEVLRPAFGWLTPDTLLSTLRAAEIDKNSSAETWLSISALAKRLGVSSKTIHRLIGKVAQQDVVPFQYGKVGSQWRIDYCSFLRYFNTQRTLKS